MTVARKVVPVPDAAAAIANVATIPLPAVVDEAASDSRLKTQDSRLAYMGRPIGYWTAVNEFKSGFASIDECKAFLEVELFPGCQGEVPITQVEAAISGRHDQPALRVLKTG